jgi:hypothetical protein
MDDARNGFNTYIKLANTQLQCFTQFFATQLHFVDIPRISWVSITGSFFWYPLFSPFSSTLLCLDPALLE